MGMACAEVVQERSLFGQDGTAARTRNTDRKQTSSRRLRSRAPLRCTPIAAARVFGTCAAASAKQHTIHMGGLNMATSNETNGVRRARRFHVGIEEFFLQLALAALVIGAMFDTTLKLGSAIV